MVAQQDEPASTALPGSIAGAYTTSDIIDGEGEAQIMSNPVPSTAPVDSKEHATAEVLSPAPAADSPPVVRSSGVGLDLSVVVNPTPEASTGTSDSVDVDFAAVSGQPAASSASLPMYSPADGYEVEPARTASSGQAEEPIPPVCKDALPDVSEVEESFVCSSSPPALPETDDSVASPSVGAPSLATDDEPDTEGWIRVGQNWRKDKRRNEQSSSCAVSDSPSPRSVPSDGNGSGSKQDDEPVNTNASLLAGSAASSRRSTVAFQSPVSWTSVSNTEKVRNRRGRGHGKGKGANRNPPLPVAAHPPMPPAPRIWAPIKPAGNAWGLCKSTETGKKVEVDCAPINASDDGTAALQAMSLPMSICETSSSSGIVQPDFVQDAGVADVDMVSVEPVVQSASMIFLPASGEGSSSIGTSSGTTNGADVDLASIIVQALALARPQVVSPPVSDSVPTIDSTVLEPFFIRGTAPMEVDVAPGQSTASYQFSTPPVTQQPRSADGNASSIGKSTGTGKKVKLNDAPVIVSNVAPAPPPSVVVPVSDLTPRIDNNIVKPFCVRGTAPVDVNLKPVQPSTSYQFSTLPVIPVSLPPNSGDATTSSNGKSTGNGKKQRINNGLATSRHAPDQQPRSSSSVLYAKPDLKRSVSPSFVTGNPADKGKGTQVDRPPTQPAPTFRTKAEKHADRRNKQHEKKRSFKAAEAVAKAPASSAVAEDATSDVEMPEAQEPDVEMLPGVAEPDVEQATNNTSEEDACKIDDEL